MRGDEPFVECFLSKRYTDRKGWGGATYKDVESVGEIFIYHPVVNHDDRIIDDIETVKILNVKKNKKGSLHFHVEKKEIFYVVSGEFEITLMKDGTTKKTILEKDDGLQIRPGMVHQIKGLADENILLEVSTLDKKDDSYRIMRGD